ncbi:MAG: hemoglobin [Sediminibacterium sp.]|nr:hemoglobin [Sediminibacterium sp.]
MTQQQISIVKDSWKLACKMDPHQIGHVFYSRLFLQMPSLRPMFKPSMTDQYQKIVDTLSTIIERLGHLEELNEDIRQLALRHVAYGVQPVHYTLVGEALLWTLGKGLGEAWTDEMSTAWSECYGELSRTMIAAANGR